jgi:hypothetical protein
VTRDRGAREPRPLGEHSKRREAAGRAVAELLRDAPLPDEGAARERARRTVLAAHAATPRRSRPRTAAIATTVILALAGAGALTRPGQAVGEWLGHRLEVVQEHKGPASPAAPRRQTGLQLPARGRLLVSGGGALWIVDRGGHRTKLGDWSSGAWSPHGLHVAAASGRALAAVRPDGTLRWRHLAPARVEDQSWSPDGLNIAYRVGGKVHLIYGTGEHDIPLPGRAAPAAPVWRPNAPNTLAWARADGTVLVQDAYTGLVLWRHRGGPVRHLSWSADGRRLLIAGRRHGAVHTLATGHTRRLPSGDLLAAAFAPTGGRVALAYRGDHATRVSLLGSKTALVEVPGRVSTFAWSPDGRWLLTPSGGDWLLAKTRGAVAVISVPAKRFGATRALGWIAP